MECKRCGICCEKGGPVLHQQDQSFLEKNLVTLENLRVIRQGELAFNPLHDLVEPAPVEMIKLAGSGDRWECPFHQKEGKLSACQIHGDRPLECRLLKCWDTADIKDVIFKNCLTRFDLIGDDNPILPHILSHEKCCSYSKLWRATSHADPEPIQAILNQDMDIRKQLIADFNLNLVQELFYLGQPMFRGLRDSAFTVSFANDELQVSYMDSVVSD